MLQNMTETWTAEPVRLKKFSYNIYSQVIKVKLKNLRRGDVLIYKDPNNRPPIGRRYSWLYVLEVRPANIRHKLDAFQKVIRYYQSGLRALVFTVKRGEFTSIGESHFNPGSLCHMDTAPWEDEEAIKKLVAIEAL